MFLFVFFPGKLNSYLRCTYYFFIHINFILHFFPLIKVHEKSILLVALPAMALYSEQPFLINWFLQITTCSMFPLLYKDGLTIPFIVMSFIYFLIFDILNDSNFFVFEKNCKVFLVFNKLSNVIIFALIYCFLFVATPAKYPDLYILLLALFSFLHFFVFLIYYVCKQLRL